ncbi:hypothetical protein OZX67_01405 [Bifidobacterium sp. ESL0728]|uniref:hypothetical protein n=1 Tax=Bifidobacterium sp. ESL0728 TaxID=2983220 RepID=UPI0023F7A65F|nr:hypothetical protein [Bifidobacterium sp. ESL0728]WEV59256.1 hypothetical protein OZX67_01405 [Bifidobacterium sp. ESL0728]
MNSEEIEKQFGFTPQQLDEKAAEYESGEWRGPIDPVIQMHPMTDEERTAINQVREYYRQKHAEEAKSEAASKLVRTAR